MTDTRDFPEPELEPELEPVLDQFFSMNTLLRNLPYLAALDLAALALAIFGVAYSNFSGHAINGYWQFSSQRYKSLLPSRLVSHVNRAIQTKRIQ